jgi:hypothetical protein
MMGWEICMRGLGALILVGMLMLQGCVLVAVGVVAGAAAGVTYTVFGTAEKTFDEDFATQILNQTADNLAKKS